MINALLLLPVFGEGFAGRQAQNSVNVVLWNTDRSRERKEVVVRQTRVALNIVVNLAVRRLFEADKVVPQFAGQLRTAVGNDRLIIAHRHLRETLVYVV